MDILKFASKIPRFFLFPSPFFATSRSSHKINFWKPEKLTIHQYPPSAKLKLAKSLMTSGLLLRVALHDHSIGHGHSTRSHPDALLMRIYGDIKWVYIGYIYIYGSVYIKSYPVIPHFPSRYWTGRRSYDGRQGVHHLQKQLLERQLQGPRGPTKISPEINGIGWEMLKISRKPMGKA